MQVCGASHVQLDLYNSRYFEYVMPGACAHSCEDSANGWKHLRPQSGPLRGSTPTIQEATWEVVEDMRATTQVGPYWPYGSSVELWDLGLLAWRSDCRPICRRQRLGREPKGGANGTVALLAFCLSCRPAALAKLSPCLGRAGYWTCHHPGASDRIFPARSSMHVATKGTLSEN